MTFMAPNEDKGSLAKEYADRWRITNGRRITDAIKHACEIKESKQRKAILDFIYDNIPSWYSKPNNPGGT